ncbi:MAG: hypothetical protein ACRC1T_05045 [Clostridium chrysemydis]|uniref:hypothetical protein n=1 Tax=Clostridium chrysemydis TaxID=2665504 RepID=UPI003F404AA6
MNLNEAIWHCRNKTIELAECNKNCSDEHFQLMNWLIELRDLKQERTELADYLIKRKSVLERKLESKREPQFYGVDPQIIHELNAGLFEIEELIDFIRDIEY